MSMKNPEFVLTVVMDDEEPAASRINFPSAVILARLGMEEQQSPSYQESDDTVSMGYLAVTCDPENTEPIELEGKSFTPDEICAFIVRGAYRAFINSVRALAEPDSTLGEHTTP